MGRFGEADGGAVRAGGAHWMTGLSTPARRAAAPRQPDMSRGAGAGWPTQQQQQQATYYDGAAYADYQEPARAREGDLRRYAGERYEEEGDNEGEDVADAEDMSPNYEEYDGLDSVPPAGGRAYDRMAGADAEESAAYISPPAPGPVPMYGRGGAAAGREEAGRGGGRAGGKEVADWFSVLVNAEVPCPARCTSCARACAALCGAGCDGGYVFAGATYAVRVPVDAAVQVLQPFCVELVPCSCPVRDMSSCGHGRGRKFHVYGVAHKIVYCAEVRAVVCACGFLYAQIRGSSSKLLRE
jgi:hypothetical protein